MKRILLYTVCGLAMLTMFNSCHIYNKYHRPDVDVEGLFRDTVAAGDTLAADSLNMGNLPWEEVFTDTILQNLIRIGLEKNSDLQSAMLQVEAAQASFNAARLEFLVFKRSSLDRLRRLIKQCGQTVFRFSYLLPQSRYRSRNHIAIRFTLRYRSFICHASNLHRFYRLHALFPQQSGLFRNSELLIEHQQGVITISYGSDNLCTNRLFIRFALH